MCASSLRGSLPHKYLVFGSYMNSACMFGQGGFWANDLRRDSIFRVVAQEPGEPCKVYARIRASEANMGRPQHRCPRLLRTLVFALASCLVLGQDGAQVGGDTSVKFSGCGCVFSRFFPLSNPKQSNGCTSLGFCLLICSVKHLSYVQISTIMMACTLLQCRAVLTEYPALPDAIHRSILLGIYGRIPRNNETASISRLKTSQRKIQNVYILKTKRKRWQQQYRQNDYNR